jgi:hypothetical protein
MFVCPTTSSAQDTAGLEAHPTLAAGFAFPLVGYEAYGIGVDVRAGLDLVLDGERSHLLSLELAWAALAIPGARIDLVPLTVGWRWVPAPEVGFYTVVAGGAGLAFDMLEAQLGPRNLGTFGARPAVFVVAGIGWIVVEHFDIEILYRQAVISGELVDPLGTIGARLGGRL